MKLYGDKSFDSVHRNRSGVRRRARADATRSTCSRFPSRRDRRNEGSCGDGQYPEPWRSICGGPPVQGGRMRVERRFRRPGPTGTPSRRAWSGIALACRVISAARVARAPLSDLSATAGSARSRRTVAACPPRGHSSQADPVQFDRRRLRFSHQESAPARRVRSAPAGQAAASRWRRRSRLLGAGAATRHVAPPVQFDRRRLCARTNRSTHGRRGLPPGEPGADHRRPSRATRTRQFPACRGRNRVRRDVGPASGAARAAGRVRSGLSRHMLSSRHRRRPARRDAHRKPGTRPVRTAPGPGPPSGWATEPGAVRPSAAQAPGRKTARTHPSSLSLNIR
jgi:hypothetical protein